MSETTLPWEAAKVMSTDLDVSKQQDMLRRGYSMNEILDSANGLNGYSEPGLLSVKSGHMNIEMDPELRALIHSTMLDKELDRQIDFEDAITMMPRYNMTGNIVDGYRMEAVQGPVIDMLSALEKPTCDAACMLQLEAGKAELNKYLFPTGTSSYTSNKDGSLNEQALADVRGEGRSANVIAVLRESAQEYLAASKPELEVRKKIAALAGLAYGEKISIRMPGQTRDITLQLDQGTMELGTQLGLSKMEIMAKTGYNVYKGVIDAAYNSQTTIGDQVVTIGGLELSGFWRPTKEMWNDYATANWTQSVRINKLTAAGVSTSFIDNKGVKHIGEANWSVKHNVGSAIDISGLLQRNANGTTSFVSMKNSSKAKQDYPNSKLLVKAFSRELVTGGADKVIQPWETFGVLKSELSTLHKPVINPRSKTTDGFLYNVYKDTTEMKHSDHLHVSYL